MSEAPTPPTGTQHRDDADDCCASVADPRIARHFDGDMVRHRGAGTLPEMVHTSRKLLELLSDVTALRPSVLELGAGSGALSVALLERGASRTDAVDLSPASVELARQRAEAAGVADRAAFSVGDGSVAALEPHDWVVLDRVICCYEHVDRLLANALGAARQRLAMSVPLSTGWRSVITKAIVTVENATNRLRGRPCPGFVHSVPMIERRLAAAGFSRVSVARVELWHVAVYERSSAT